MADFVLDFGNARIKWFDPRSNAHGDNRHAIVQLTDAQWDAMIGRGKPAPGFIRVNGTPFAVGDAARRYIIQERPKGASRYRDTYYSVGMCYALAEGFKRSMRKVMLIASHPPVDIGYAPVLISAARKTWHVVSVHGETEFDVQDVFTFDEPLGGYSHFVFTENGQDRKRNPLQALTTLVIDAGGYTVDVAAIDTGGEIDPISLKSTRTGVLDVFEQFETELRGNNSTLFQDTGDIDAKKIETSLLSGQFKFGKVMIDCGREADAALNAFVNDVVQVINSAGGVANYDAMLLTGGGAALIYDRLVNALPRAEFLLAEPSMPLMKYANVFGGAKLVAMLRRIGEL